MLIRKKKHLPQLMHISLLTTLFASLVCYCFATVSAGKGLIGCQVVAAMYQFFFLSTMCWTNALAITVTHTIYSFTTSRGSRKGYIGYTLYALGLPLFITLVTYGLAVEEDNPNLNLQSTVYRDNNFCFLRNSIVLYALFLGPIYLIIIVNFILCVACMIRVSHSYKIGSNDKDRKKKNIITCIKLSTCLGLGWSLLFFTQAFPKLRPALGVFVEVQGLLIVSAEFLRWKCVSRIQSRLTTINTDSTSRGSTQHSTQRVFKITRVATPSSQQELGTLNYSGSSQVFV